ncbi:hypothetical protein [Effusibacillus consociatus]|uniref:Uncharacterized protein n=1 Tax=Effusibacillus consociatus TaxID=1117041 RepID=A0ABV9Q5I4_9BACL
MNVTYTIKILQIGSLEESTLQIGVSLHGDSCQDEDEKGKNDDNGIDQQEEGIKS